MNIKIVVDEKFWLISNPEKDVSLRFSLNEKEAVTFDDIQDALRCCYLLEDYDESGWEITVNEDFVLRPRHKPNAKKELLDLIDQKPVKSDEGDEEGNEEEEE